MQTASRKSRFIDPGSTAMAAIASLVMGALVFTVAPAAEAEDAATLTVSISGIEKTEGVIRLGVFDEAGYDGGEAVAGANIDVDGETVEAAIEGLAPGAYGIKLYQDVDANGEMNANPFGMPTEPYAFSNNAQGRFGPAKWEDAMFEVTADGAAQAISLN